MGDVQNGGLSPTSPRPTFGVMPNRPHQYPNSVCAFPGYTLAIVEFDDQGRCYDRRQMGALADKLKRLEGGDAIIVVFVHGWKHDSRSDDDNLRSFQSVLAALAAEEGPRGVPVLGVFVAWRGLSLFGFGLDNLTFWDRKQAGLRVSMGAPRELFGRLRQFRNERQRQGGAPLLVLIGHSFGGMIVYAALAQSLIEAASTQSGKIVPSFADLILLVNPAFEAVRYLPVHDILKGRGEGSFPSNQNPVFVSVTATNDWATGLAFPAGMLITRLEEATLGTEEKQALINTMGHLPWMLTHALSDAAPTTPDPTTQEIGGCWLKRLRFDPHNPFWVASATPKIIDGHNGIWLQPFRDFAAALVTGHMSTAREARNAAQRL
jgi:pimeloyl-ACP methyl ester carboxylesterase